MRATKNKEDKIYFVTNGLGHHDKIKEGVLVFDLVLWVHPKWHHIREK